MSDLANVSQGSFQAYADIAFVFKQILHTLGEKFQYDKFQSYMVCFDQNVEDFYMISVSNG